MDSYMTTAIEWDGALIPDNRDYGNIIPINEIAVV